jgi:hypothetical protein
MARNLAVPPGVEIQLVRIARTHMPMMTGDKLALPIPGQPGDPVPPGQPEPDVPAEEPPPPIPPAGNPPAQAPQPRAV